MSALLCDAGMSLHPSEPRFPRLNGSKSTALAGLCEGPAGPASSTVPWSGSSVPHASEQKPCLVPSFMQ